MVKGAHPIVLDGRRTRCYSRFHPPMAMRAARPRTMTTMRRSRISGESSRKGSVQEPIILKMVSIVSSISSLSDSGACLGCLALALADPPKHKAGSNHDSQPGHRLPVSIRHGVEPRHEPAEVEHLFPFVSGLRARIYHRISFKHCQVIICFCPSGSVDYRGMTRCSLEGFDTLEL